VEERLPPRIWDERDHEAHIAAARLLKKATEHTRNYVEINRRYGAFYPRDGEVCEELVTTWGKLKESEYAEDVYIASLARGVAGPGAFAKLIYAKCDMLKVRKARLRDIDAHRQVLYHHCF
jgi:hypothetical protein